MGLKTLSMEDITRTLLQEPHVTRFIREEWESPEIDFSMWFVSDREVARKYAGKLTDYLNFPYVEDDFKDHQARRDWRKQMAIKHHWFHDFYSKNPFRNNRINVAIESAKVLRFGYYGTNNYDLQSLIVGIEGFRTDGTYHNLAQNDKREIVYGLKANILILLTFLGEQSPQLVGKSAYKAV